MDDFDRLLEFQLRRKLDRVVAAPVPVRRGRAGHGRATATRDPREDVPLRRLGVIPIQLKADALVYVEHS